ncbi:hypothetical protein [Peribacillus butanolivorans]|uniref:hypothetical protein n=1 Tax=Peribacillus butanolivorans TaxID=421767 RepID=UPI0035DD587A
MRADEHFQNELENRIAIITDPQYAKSNLENLKAIDFIGILFLILGAIFIFLLSW